MNGQPLVLSDTPDHNECWKALKPVVDEISRLLMTAPINDTDKSMLGLKVVSHFMGVMTALMQKSQPALATQPHSVTARLVMEQIIPMMDAAMLRMKN